jgi:molecular chaperone Hsp33
MVPGNMMTSQEQSAPEPIALAGDDRVRPFHVPRLDVRGRAIQIDPMLNAILDRHHYPAPVARLLGEAIALTVLLGTTLKFDGQLILQTQSNGPVSMMVVDFRTPDSVRAYASFHQTEIEEAISSGHDAPHELLGTGSLAMTIDQGAHTSRYQGVVELDGTGLANAAHQYFLQSEQIPTRIRLAVSELIEPSGDGSEPRRSWRAGGILVQFLPESEDRQRNRDLPSGDPDAEFDGTEDDAWVEAEALVDTVSDDELTDPDIPVETLIYRLFHESEPIVYAAQAVYDRCSCSAEKITEVLTQFSTEELDESVDDAGAIEVTCEFCSTKYHIERAALSETNSD